MAAKLNFKGEFTGLFSLVSMVCLVMLVLFQADAQAADFSKNPFAESQKRLEGLGSYSTILNAGQSQSTPSTTPSIVIGAPSPMLGAPDATTSNAGIFNRALSGYAGFNSGFSGFSGFNPYSSMYRGGWGGYSGYSGWHGWGGYGGYGGWGNWGGYGGYGGWGFNSAGPAWSAGYGPFNEMGGTYYYQSSPSKASGNYYAPSTTDSTASGNYYSSNSPPVSMPIKPYTTPDNYWGQSGSPLPKDINKVPW
ncbi:MAG: hypothetical protein R3F51_12295 [Cyanobacteriota/Melainabacteria group bacterium]